MDMKKLQLAADVTKSFEDRLNSIYKGGIFYTLENGRNLTLFKTQPEGNFPAGYAKYGLGLLYSVKETDRNYGLDKDNVIDVVYFNNIDKLFRHVEDMLDTDASFPLKIEKKTYTAQIVGTRSFTCEATSIEEAEKMYDLWASKFDKGDFDFGTVDFDPLELECEEE